MGFCNCSMFCCALLCVLSSFACISMGKRELLALLCLSFWCLVFCVCLFLRMSRVCLQFVIVVFPDHTHLLFFLWLFLTKLVCSVRFWYFLITFTDFLVQLTCRLPNLCNVSSQENNPNCDETKKGALNSQTLGTKIVEVTV